MSDAAATLNRIVASLTDGWDHRDWDTVPPETIRDIEHLRVALDGGDPREARIRELEELIEKIRYISKNRPSDLGMIEIRDLFNGATVQRRG